MEIDCIPFAQTGYFSKLICDYLDQKKELKPFYNRYPELGNFKAQILEKQKGFPTENRNILVKSLEKQYQQLALSEATEAHITQLSDTNTFTVVTGHQLNLFTGPLYFLYKIAATINLTKALKQEYPEHNFVPIYWMATEDHDFDEINFFNFQGQKIQWKGPKNYKGGAVGRLNTDGLEALYETFSKVLGSSKNANQIKALFENSYVKHDTLTEATRYLVNVLFGSYGLVIVDGDDRSLKQLLIPYIKKDIFQEIAHEKVSETVDQLSNLSEGYKIQVNPRAINYFYLASGVRERIVKEERRFLVNNTTISFSREELEKEIETYPERFSPNVICRPLYQEVILPNLCYIGGGGELAYWLQLRSSFEAVDIPFPMLLLRNSALVVSQKQAKKLKNLSIAIEDLFLNPSSFINKRIREISNIDINFSQQKEHLADQFKELYTLAKQTDASFLGAVKAQEVKQIKGLEHLEKRLLQAQKRKLKDEVVRMSEAQRALFPNNSLQERNANFSSLYLEYGEALIPSILEGLKPLSGTFSILTLT